MPASARPAPSLAATRRPPGAPETERPGDAPGRHPSDEAVAALSSAQLAAIAPLRGWAADLVEACGDGISLWAEFVAGRMRADGAARHDAFRCTTAAELARLQADWAQGAMNDWRDLSARLAALARTAAARMPGGSLLD